MGRASRSKPEKLAKKLLLIRKELGLSQTELIEKLACDNIPLYKGDISKYESGKREPPLLVLLRYARLANVIVDVLIDDEMDLPARIPNQGQK
jgi:transcriptional regulator with XRE-family HTH domain